MPSRKVNLNVTVVGLSWVVLAGVNFVGFVVLIKYVGSELPPVQAAFIRYLFGLVVLLPLFIRNGTHIFDTKHIHLHGLRGFIQALAVMLWFYAVTKLPIAEVTALGFVSPIFVVFGAVFFLRERLTKPRIAAVILGLVGIFVILRPGFISMEFGPLLILLASFIWGSILVVIKSLGRSDAPGTIILYMVAFMTPLSLIPALFVWVWPTAEQIGLMFIMGIMGTVGQLTTAHALKVADTAVVMPIDFFRLVWASILGYFLFAEMLDIFTWIGGTMIFTGALYLALRERKEQRETGSK